MTLSDAEVKVSLNSDFNAYMKAIFLTLIVEQFVSLFQIFFAYF